MLATTMCWRSSLLIWSLIGLQVSAYWRMPCMGVVGRGLIDPIVSPGTVSSHLHSIKGASGISTNSTVNDLLASHCTSCQIAQDKSAYWTPQLYFYDQTSNSFQMVPEVSTIVYYKPVPHFISNGTYLNAIPLPNGLQLRSGDNLRRNLSIPTPDPPRPWTGSDATQDALRQKAIGFNCLNYAAPPEGTLERHFLPNKQFLQNQCVDGIRAEIVFPTCWDGLRLKSDDMYSHVAYGDAGANGGNCPEGYNTVITQLLFETIYSTQYFRGNKGYYVFSNGDPTGNGYHGDALIAWEPGVQQDAIKSCGDPVRGPYAQDGVVEHCPYFNIVPQAEQAVCSIQATKEAIRADFEAKVATLPGNNPVQFGPDQATLGNTDIGSPSNTPTLQSAATITTDIITPLASPTRPSTSLITSVISSEATSSGERVLSTTTYTSSGTVYEIIQVETITTVTVPGSLTTAAVTD